MRRRRNGSGAAVWLGVLYANISRGTAQTAPQCAFTTFPPDLSLPCRFYMPLPTSIHPDYRNDVGDESECNLKRVDTIVELCGGSFDATYTWSIDDSTSLTGTNTVVQTIHVTDTTPPVLNSLPAATLHFCADTGIPEAQIITAADPCSTVTVLIASDTVVGDRIDREYAAEDMCGNRATFTQQLYSDGACPTLGPSAPPTTSAPTTAVDSGTNFQQQDGTTEITFSTTMLTDTTTSVSQVDGVAADRISNTTDTQTGITLKRGTKGLQAAAEHEEDIEVTENLSESGILGTNSSPTIDMESGKKKGKRKLSKSSGGKRSRLTQLNTVNNVSIASGVLVVAMVVGVAVGRRRKWAGYTVKDLSKQPLMLGNSVSQLQLTTADGFTYAQVYESCA